MPFVTHSNNIDFDFRSHLRLTLSLRSPSSLCQASLDTFIFSQPIRSSWESFCYYIRLRTSTDLLFLGGEECYRTSSVTTTLPSRHLAVMSPRVSLGTFESECFLLLASRCSPLRLSDLHVVI